MAFTPVPAPEIPESYWSKLEEIYTSHRQDAEWQIEKPRLKELLPLVVTALGKQYVFDEPIKCGGAGIVSRIIDVNLTSLSGQNVYRAIKFPRPAKGTEHVLSESLVKEFKTLAGLTHTNVIKLY